ncbi:MAG: lipase [Labilithrix sp.]|nr:lipase [Labilithrix sp.]
MTRAARALALLSSAACSTVSGPNAVPVPVDGGSDAAAEAGLAVAPDPTCTTNGCVRSAIRRDDVPLGVLRSVVDSEVAVDNGFSVWSIEYVTGETTSLATVTIPIDVAPPQRGFGIVANNHGTTGVDDPCAITGTPFGAGLAGLFGAHGTIGVASDYPGIGTPGVHPYLVSDVTGRAVLDSLRAAKALATWQAVPTSGRFGVVGASQGGHATLAAAAMQAGYAPELDIRAFSVAAPASMFEEQWRRDLFSDGKQIIWQTMLVYAWLDHYGYEGPSPWVTGFETTVRTVMTSRCAFPLNGTSPYYEVIGVERAKIFAPAFVLAYQTGNWGEYRSFATWYAANRVRPFAQKAPLHVYQGANDDIVLPSGTDALVNELRAGGVTVDYEMVAGGTHTDVAFGPVTAAEHRTAPSIAWVRERLEAP